MKFNRKFHVVVVQRRLRKVQKKRVKCKVVALLFKLIAFFVVLVAVAVVVA